MLTLSDSWLSVRGQAGERNLRTNLSEVYTGLGEAGQQTAYSTCVPGAKLLSP